MLCVTGEINLGGTKYCFVLENGTLTLISKHKKHIFRTEDLFNYKHVSGFKRLKFSPSVYKFGNRARYHNYPRVILQTYKTYPTPEKYPELSDSVAAWKSLNPDWEYKFFDDIQGEEFIRKHFDNDTANAFKVIKVGAFKADLLRVCLSYIYGGVYADIKIHPKFPLDDFLDGDMILTKERPLSKGLWNAFYVCQPGEQYMKEIIEKIVENTKNLDKGRNYFHFSGPELWGEKFYKYYPIRKTIGVHVHRKTTIRMYLYNVKYLKKNSLAIAFLSTAVGQIPIAEWRCLYKGKQVYPIAWLRDEVFDKKLHQKLFST